MDVRALRVGRGRIGFGSNRACIIAWIAVASLTLISSQARADVEFYISYASGNSNPSKAAWLGDLGAQIVFPTEAANLALADEVPSPPGGNTNVPPGPGDTMTFQAASTGLDWSFALSSPGTVGDPGATPGFTYNDNEGGSIWRSGALSPGDINNGENDDLTVTLIDGPPLTAIGFDMLDSTVDPNVYVETVRVFGEGDVEIGVLELPEHGLSTAANLFIGIISPLPIIRVEVDEDPGGDDVAYRDIRFGVAPGADPYADAVESYNPVIKNGDPNPPNITPSNAIGGPDGSSVSLGDGGEIVLEFSNNSLTGSGSPDGDLRIYEIGAEQEDTAVSVSPDGVVWYSLGSVGGSTSTVDLDAFGFGLADEFFFVRLIDDPDEGGQTGDSVGADIDAVEALNGRFYPPDADFDLVSDAFDNCPDFFNPSQEDEDGDGVGDFCDNCKDDANAGQEDTNVDGVGDVCQPARLSLERDYSAPLPTYDLVFYGNGVATTELNVAFTVPSGSLASDIDFGGGCESPPLAIPGATPGLGCTANPNLSSKVNAGASGVYVPSTGFGYDENSIYVHFEGSGVDGRINDPGDGPIVLARMGSQSALGLGFSFLNGRGLLLNGLVEAGGLGGDPRPGTGKDNTSGASDPDVEFLLTPSAGESTSTARRWDVCLSEESDQRMRRIAIGLRVPDSTTGNVRLLGCDGPPDMNGVRQCAADSSAILGGFRVDESQSFTVGPFTSATFPTLERTLYVVLEANLQFPGEGAKSFGGQAEQLCLGTIEIDAPAGAAGESPIFEVEGLDLLPYADLDPTPWIPTNSALATSLDKVGFNNQFNSGDDLDDDGALDNADNCRFTKNGTQETNGQANNGDVLKAELEPDSDGDACECGDADGSGGVFAPDLQLIREHLVGLNPGNATAVEAICSVSEGIACDTKDAVVLERALNVQAPGVLPQCDAAQPD